MGANSPFSFIPRAAASRMIGTNKWPLNSMDGANHKPRLFDELEHHNVSGCPQELVTAGNYALSASGTFPPFSASLTITCLCSQIFMAAEFSISPV